MLKMTLLAALSGLRTKILKGLNATLTLDREQPGLLMALSVPGRRMNSCVRHGSTSLLSALGVTSGGVIGKRCKRHRAVEVLKPSKRFRHG
ncbi:hypothetical protein E4K65_44925 [Bradyrhizobium niftali]|uniref:Uncharacterized protein n=1 Tax=Bradyrhizobium niftali TaxID=2560055 RepID=A0A4Y9L3K0_9BRAD|nr:hypothetical protein E4K65_44925 [Bradyrhizobium niftali]